MTMVTTMAPISPVKHDRRQSLLTAERRRVLDNIWADVQQAVNPNKINPADLQKLAERKWWILAFYKANKEDIHVTSAVIQECLRWRKANAVSHMRMIQFVQSQRLPTIYLRGKDVYDNPILWIMMSDHDPTDRSIDRLLIYWLEVNFQLNSLAPMTVVLNLTGCKAVDLTFVKFMLHTFKYWYPGSLGELILYNVPQRLTASIHVIQSVIANYDFSMAHELHEPNQIRAFVREDTLPLSMDGTDVFTIDDIAECVPSELVNSDEMLASQVPVSANGSVQVDSSTDIASTTTSGRVSIDDVISAKRTVHFHEHGDEPVMANSIANGGSRGSSVVRKPALPNAVRAIIDQRKAADADEWFDAGFVAISPKQCLVLKQVGGGVDPVDVFVIKNTGNTGLQFKIKTTSPEKFRVRPSVGFVSAGETSVVRIYLQNGYQTTIKSERFLFMGLQTNNEDPDAFITTWKQASAEEKVEKTFNCVADSSVVEALTQHAEPPLTPIPTRTSVDLENLELRRKIAELGQRQLIIICMLLFLLVVTFISVVQFRSAVDTLKDALDDVHHATKKAYKHSDL